VRPRNSRRSPRFANRSCRAAAAREPLFTDVEECFVVGRGANIAALLDGLSPDLDPLSPGAD